MAKDRHTREYYIQYARKHPYWCKAYWYLSKEELTSLRNNNNNNNLYKNFEL